MSSRWCAYFDETNPQDYRFLDFYEYRSKQVDFTLSFQKESYKLQADLALLTKEGSQEMKEVANLKGAPIATVTMECCSPYGWNARYGKTEPVYTTTTTVTMECCTPYGWNACCTKDHRETLRNVDVFWQRIELNIELQAQLQNIEVEGTSSLISTSAETLKTAVGNINCTVENINNTLKLSGNSTPGQKRACENDTELPSTPPNKVRLLDTEYNSDFGLCNGESSSSDSEIVPRSLTNIFLEAKNFGDGDGDDDNESVEVNEQSNLGKPISEPLDNNEYGYVPKPRITRNKPKYIQHDLAQ
ncbi:11601_t:CDS:2, partial [Diversispora eburnea]